jgi:hypothetical protein
MMSIHIPMISPSSSEIPCLDTGQQNGRCPQGGSSCKRFLRTVEQLRFRSRVRNPSGSMKKWDFHGDFHGDLMDFNGILMGFSL